MDHSQKKYIFSHYFNLHPLDAHTHTQQLIHSLELFTNAFKHRIELELDYSKSLLHISKHLEKHIQPNKPSPISYISSAFKVEHEQRARHAIELAQYLHTEIEAPCQLMLDKHQASLKQLEKQLKAYYKEGESVEEDYQKNLRKFYKSRQQWEQKMIQNSILCFTPGVSKGQREKTVSKLKEQKGQTQQMFGRYLKSLQVFNSFARRYNKEIKACIEEMEEKAVQSLGIQTTSIRKLIVSEISMFKNIEYDLINISKQMEIVDPNQEIQLITQEFKSLFKSPIISIYSEGPISHNRFSSIDLKIPMQQTLLSETLHRIQSGLFQSILENKNNSTMRYCVQRLLLRYEGREQSTDNQFLSDFQESIRMNKVMSKMGVDGLGGSVVLLDGEQAYSVCLQVVSMAGQYLQPYQLNAQKQQDSLQLITTYITIHHFYRFIVLTTLQQYDSICEGKIANRTSALHYAQILGLLLEQGYKHKDVFVVRHVIGLMFKTVYIEQEKEHYFYEEESLYALDYWQNKGLWEALIFQACYELISLLPTTQNAQLKQIFMMKQKNLIFSGLLSYCHYMVMLGMQSVEVRQIMGGFSQTYNLYEEHSRDLSKSISHSYAQYQQMNRIA